MSEEKEDARKGHRDETSQDLEAVLMAVWRRVIEEGCGPEMSLTEAAAVLGASVGSVRKRVAEGVIPAYRDARGRIRIVPRLNPASQHVAPVASAANVAEASEAPVPASMVGRLMDELRSTREQLNQAVRERSGLQKEMAAAEQALEHTKDELGAMWRLLSARTSAPMRVEVTAIPDSRPHPIAHISPSGVNVAKIQSQITAVRKLAKRRKWPWALVG